MFLTMLGGLALFMTGVKSISSGLQQFAGPASRRWMAAATGSPIKALLTGTAVAGITQSGTATAVTALSLVAGGLVPAGGALAMALGGKLGATVAIQLAAFKLGEHALALIGIGFLAGLWNRSRPLGALVMGAGLLFLGLDLTVHAVGGLQESEVFRLLLDGAESQPVAVALLGFALGAALSSSNAAAIVALGLYLPGAVSLPTAIVLIAGGNVGSGILNQIVARGLGIQARRVALVHIMVDGAGALAVIAGARWFAELITAIGGDAARQVANAHTLFNVGVALLGTLLAAPLSALGSRMVREGEDDSAPKYLRDYAAADPDLALALALRETVRVSDQVAVMMEVSVGFLDSGRWEIGVLEQREEKVDKLTADIVNYLARVRRKSGNVDDEESERLMLAVIELEHMGDQIKRLQRREERLKEAGVQFSSEGRRELAETGRMVLARMQLSFTALATGDREMAQQVLDERPALEKHVARMRVAHLGRLEAQLPESRASSSHHLELLTLMRHIDASVSRLAAWSLEIYPSNRS